MAMKIHVKLHGQVIQTLELSDPQTIYWGGRNDQCQIPLKASNGISRQHFKIYCKEGIWHLEVVSRFNQIMVGQEAVTGMVLKGGLSFSLAPFEFTIEEPSQAVVDEGLSAVVGDPFARGSYHQEDQNIGDRTVTRAIEKSAQFVFMYRGNDSRSEKIHILTHDSYNVGRDPVCEIVIDDPRVSRRQFRLERKNGRYLLFDNLGVNGTYLNKKKIESKDPVPLKSGDRIVVLNHKFYFEVRDPDFDNKLQRVQHLALVEPVLPTELQEPQDFHEGVGLPVPDPSNGYGGLQPIQGGYPFPAQGGYAPQIDFNQNPQNSGVASNEKVLNFWGLKIPLNKQNKIRLALAAIALAGVIFVLSEEQSDQDAATMVAAAPSDPFSRLTPDEQKQVTVQYETAHELYRQGKYELAEEEIAKIHAKIPSYKESQKLAETVANAKEYAKKVEEQARIDREKAEMIEKIQNIVVFCRQQIKPDTTSDEIEACLGPAIQLNPEDEQIMAIRQDVAKVEEERKIKERDEALKQAEAETLEKLFNEAKATGAKDPRKGIEMFKDIQTRTMHDPKKLIEKSKSEIVKLEKKIKAKVHAAIASVRGLVDSGKHKEAVMALERAAEVSPEDDSLKEEIDKIIEELRKKMQALYQEAILEENIGNIDTAKDRWQKILSQDIPNGEYFIKASMKLKKYGGS